MFKRIALVVSLLIPIFAQAPQVNPILRQNLTRVLTAIEVDQNNIDFAAAANASQRAWGQKASATTALTWGFYGGPAFNGTTWISVGDGTITLAASHLNYVERTIAGTVSANITGWTAGKIPIAIVAVGASSISSTSDFRGSQVAEGISYLAPYTGAVTRTQNSKNADWVNLNDFAGIDPTGITECLAAINTAMSSGVGCIRAKGTYKVNGTIVIPDSVGIEGESPKTTINQMSTTLPTISLNTARSYVKNIRLQGPNTSSPYVGIGIQIGDPAIPNSASGIYQLTNVRIFNFNKAFQLCGALWTSFYDCWAENNTYGWAFDAASGSYSTSCFMYSCTSRANDRNGLVGLTVPVRNSGLTMINCDIENNGNEAPATYPQIAPGSMEIFSIDNCYIESTLTTKPDGIDLTGCGNGTVKATLFNGVKRGIFASGAVNDTVIFSNRFTNVTNGQNAIELSNSGNSQVYAFANEAQHVDSSAAPMIITGTTSNVITGKIAEVLNTSTGFTPTVSGTGGSCTYNATVTSGTYTQGGGMCHFRLRITLATSSLTGAISVNLVGLPVCANNSYLPAVVNVSTNGVTIGSSNTYFNGLIQPNTAVVSLVQDGSASGSSFVIGTQLSGTATIIISGSYPTI